MSWKTYILTPNPFSYTGINKYGDSNSLQYIFEREPTKTIKKSLPDVGSPTVNNLDRKLSTEPPELNSTSIVNPYKPSSPVGLFSGYQSAVEAAS